MPDHFHALIMPRQGHAISAVAQKIKSLFAYRLRATGMTGSIWQKSFYDFVVYSEGKLREKVPERGMGSPPVLLAGECTPYSFFPIRR